MTTKIKLAIVAAVALGAAGAVAYGVVQDRRVVSASPAPSSVQVFDPFVGSRVDASTAGARGGNSLVVPSSRMPESISIVSGRRPLSGFRRRPIGPFRP